MTLTLHEISLEEIEKLVPVLLVADEDEDRTATYQRKRYFNA